MIGVDQAVLPPGACMYCQSAVGPFVDTLRDDDDPRIEVGENQVGFGIINRLYICSRCVTNLYQAIADKVGVVVIRTDLLADERQKLLEAEALAAVRALRIEELESALRVMHALNPVAGEGESPASEQGSPPPRRKAPAR